VSFSLTYGLKRRFLRLFLLARVAAKEIFLRAKANPSRKKGPGPSSFVLRPSSSTERMRRDATRRDDPTNATPATHGDARDEDGRISVLLFPQTARGRFCLVRRLRASTTPARRRREKRRGAARFSVRFLRPTKEIFQTTFTRLIGFGGLQYIEHTADLDECPSRSRDLRLEDCVTVSRFFYKRAHAGPIRVRFKPSSRVVSERVGGWRSLPSG
jgi:hypothetical protein